MTNQEKLWERYEKLYWQFREKLWERYEKLYRQFCNEQDIYEYLSIQSTNEEIEDEIVWLEAQLEDNDNET